MFKAVCIITLFCFAVQKCSAKPQGNSLYLPPKEDGYDYPSPNKPPGKPPTPGGGPPKADQPHEPGMPFDFNFAVNDIETSNDFNHKSSSDGDVTKGEYRVLLPDGRTQVVRYTADWQNGYNAEISYE